MKTPNYLGKILLFIGLIAIMEVSALAGQFPITSDNGAKLSFGPAFDGINYLVPVQGDGLFDRADTKRQMAVQFINQSGALVGPLIDIGRNATPSSNSTPIPHAAFDGSNYLLVWTDSANHPNDDIYGQRISPAGALIGSPFPISQAPKDQSVHGMVFDGTNYLVIWEDHRRGAVADDGLAPFDTYGQRVSKTGTLVGTEIRISPADEAKSYENSVVGEHENRSLAAGATNYFVVWVEGPLNGELNTTVRGQFVSPVGTLVSLPVTIKTDDGVKISTPNLSGIGFDGTNYMVSWHQDVSPSEQNLLAQRVSRAGVLLGGRVTLSTAPAKASLPRFVFDGANYLVTWSDSFNSATQSCKARFISPTGDAVSSEFAPFSVQGTNAPLIGIPIFDGKRFMIGGLIGNFSNGDLYGTTIAPLPRGAFPIGITSGNEFGLRGAFDGTNILVGIQGGAVDHDEITAQLVTTNGILSGARVTTGRFGGIPHASFDGNRYLMVWSDAGTSPDDDIYGQFFSRAGALSGSPFPICTANGLQDLDSNNHIAFDGNNYLVVWRDYRNGAANTDIYGRIVTPNGTLSGTEITISNDTERQAGASVCFDGSNYLVVWQSRRTGAAELWDTYGKFISKAGVSGTKFLISQAASASYNPTSLAFDGSNYLVVWNRDIGPGYPAPTDWDIYGRLVTTAGGFVGNEFAITTAPGSQISFGGVIFDGYSYAITWVDTDTSSLKHRYYDRSGTPLVGEFSFFGPQGTKSPIGGFLSAGSTMLVGASFVDAQFANGDLYGLFLPKLRLDMVSPYANGNFEMKLSGAPGLNYAIQTTIDLTPATPTWTTLTSSNTLDGVFRFTHAGTGTGNQRYYRAIQQ